MIDSSLVRRSSAKDGGLPGVKMAVEVDDRDLAVSAVNRPEKRKNDGVVAAEAECMRVIGRGCACIGVWK